MFYKYVPELANDRLSTVEPFGPMRQTRQPRLSKILQRFTKRTFDVTVASMLMVLLSPLMAGVAFLVYRSSPGPVFYGHQRIGLHGNRFRCWKFRSMFTDADMALEAHLSLCSNAREEWETTKKLRNDPRVTPIGSVLRMLSIDELPQLFNVVTGEMSLVGPRPVVSDELKMYKSSARHYLSVRPGITGLWQISGRSEMTYNRRVALDRVYVTRCKTVDDFSILLRTIPVVAGRRGAW